MYGGSEVAVSAFIFDISLSPALPNVRLYTMATLTGHASRSVGQYSATMDNGPARAVRSSFGLQVRNRKAVHHHEIPLLRKLRPAWHVLESKRRALSTAP